MANVFDAFEEFVDRHRGNHFDPKTCFLAGAAWAATTARLSQEEIAVIAAAARAEPEKGEPNGG